MKENTPNAKTGEQLPTDLSEEIRGHCQRDYVTGDVDACRNRLKGEIGSKAERKVKLNLIDHYKQQSILLDNRSNNREPS